MINNYSDADIRELESRSLHTDATSPEQRQWQQLQQRRQDRFDLPFSAGDATAMTVIPDPVSAATARHQRHRRRKRRRSDDGDVIAATSGCVARPETIEIAAGGSCCGRPRDENKLFSFSGCCSEFELKNMRVEPQVIEADSISAVTEPELVLGDVTCESRTTLEADDATAPSPGLRLRRKSREVNFGLSNSGAIGDVIVQDDTSNLRTSPEQQPRRPSLSAENGR